ncbi:hypothetical protein KC19_1G320400 [Ceratodon purpureus]|uniref:DUF7798 domain-containing protein n=1 Tax=Ceratodon purpureus TaxID=3225 RepID=A0A8T0JBM2_CERPU|nr:hypothetical protein KC19_1G320400 [Ceratodon purpureus]
MMEMQESDEVALTPKESTPAAPAPAAAPASSGGGWGWGAWKSSAFSVLNEIQQAAAEAAEEIQKNAAAAAKGIADLQQSVLDDAKVDSEEVDSLKEESKEIESADPEEASEEDVRRKAALLKLESASEESFLGQGLKVLDDSVENLTTGAWQALGSAWKGSVNLVHKLESTTLNQGGVLPSNLLQSGRELTVKGIRALEYVGKETLDILASETGFDLETDEKSPEEESTGKVESYTEDVTFDHCFYIYGGPEHLEELEDLSNHYTLLCNRAKAKLSGEERAAFESQLKQLQQVLSFNGDSETGSPDSGKGKKVAGAAHNGNEIKALRESSVSQAAKLATGFAATLNGLTVAEIMQKSNDRLDAIKADSIHRLSELCTLCIGHLLLLGKLVLTRENEAEGIDWPEDCVARGQMIKERAQAMTADIEAVSDSFAIAVGDVAAAFQAALKNEIHIAKEGEEDARQGLQKGGSIEDRAQTLNSNIQEVASITVEKVHDGLQLLTYVVLSTSLKK